MDRGAWLATVHRVTKSQTQLRWLSTHAQKALTYSHAKCVMVLTDTGFSTRGIMVIMPCFPGSYTDSHWDREQQSSWGADRENGLDRYSSTVQFSSVAQSCPILCDPMNRSTPGLPVYHHLLEFTQTHIHQVGDAIQPSHPLLSPFHPAPNPSQHQSLFQWDSGHQGGSGEQVHGWNWEPKPRHMSHFPIWLHI